MANVFEVYGNGDGSRHYTSKDLALEFAEMNNCRFNYSIPEQRTYQGKTDDAKSEQVMPYKMLDEEHKKVNEQKNKKYAHNLYERLLNYGFMN